MSSLLIGGMNCEHCRKAVLQAVGSVPGVKNAHVDLMLGSLSWTDDGADMDAVKRAVENAGYEVKGEGAA